MQGILLLSKPKGMTSFAAVAAVRRLCGTKRVGHTGTLDPLAEGVLPILVGRATALSSYITETEKSYRARVRLGVTTDTEDITGKVLTEKNVSVSEEALKEAVASFLGDQAQIPPMYSAIKRDGQRLYALARQGVEVEREPRAITIKNISCYDFDGRDFTLDVTCSKGTYIRSLCRDIGEKLGTGATMTELLRTETAGFSLKATVALEKLTSENVKEYLLPAENALPTAEKLSVTEKQAIRFSNGGELDISRTGLVKVVDGALVRVMFGSVMLGVGQVNVEKNEIRVMCVINDKDGSDSRD